MSPEFKNYKNIVKFIDDQFSCNWKINRTEPFPEQYNTFIGGAGSHLHFAPVNLNKENLVREGYFEQNIFVVGNSIIDAIEQKRGNKKSSIFDIYPILEEKNDWIRVDIHRRGNLLCSRIKAIIKGMKELLKRGYNVNLIEMNAFSHALKQHNLYNDLNKLKNYKNFLHTPLWPEYAHVIEFLESGKCFAEFTDSGSMQEELNEIEQTICLTCRFNTDRPETIFEAKTNLLVPPIDGEYIANFVDYIYNTELCETMKKGKKLYGKGVANKIIQILNTQKEYPFTWAHEIAGFKESEKFQNFL
jgi:UDP-N-acetylglucosamine 2-epimerase (non-hydrolysing)